MLYRIMNVSLHTDANGDMLIKGTRESGYPFEMLINNKNPVTGIHVNNEYFCIISKAKQAEYCIYYNDVDMDSSGTPRRKLDWSGCDKPTTTRLLYLIHDLIVEVKYFCAMKKYFNKDVELEVNYLRERYKDCTEYISYLNFEVMINELIRRFEAVHGVFR